MPEGSAGIIYLNILYPVFVMAKHHVFIKSSDNIRIAGILSTPGKPGKHPAVLFLHGFLSGKDSKKTHAIIDELKDDIVCLAIDFRGHKESTGNIREITLTGCLDDARAAIDFLRDQPEVNPARLGVYGSSLGGATAIHLAAEISAIRALVLVAAVGDFKELNTHEFSPESIALWQDEGYIEFTNLETGKKVPVDSAFLADTCAYDGYVAARRIKARTLICHGDADNVVPLSHAKKLRQAIPGAMLKIIHNEGHLFTASKRTVGAMLDDIASFFKEALLP